MEICPYGPALKAYPDAPAIWVWDEALIEVAAESQTPHFYL